MVVARATMWGATLLLLAGHSLTLAAIAFFLRGSYAGCRLLVQARAGELGDGNERGVLLGAAETTISLAQVIAPYVAGRLHAIESRRPFVVSLSDTGEYVDDPKAVRRCGGRYSPAV
ncbi:MAG: hypothetical protein MUQ10_14785 [Anaerolineae bacterium]|nr:hypothetical protein [Anaerolineae bacterium]